MKSQYLLPILIMSFMLLASCSKDNDEIDYFEYNEPGKAFIHGGEIVDANTDVDMSTIIQQLQGSVWRVSDIGRINYTRNSVSSLSKGYGASLYDESFIFKGDWVKYFSPKAHLQSLWNPTPEVYKATRHYCHADVSVNEAERTVTISYKLSETEYMNKVWKIISFDTGRIIVDETEEFCSEYYESKVYYNTASDTDVRHRKIVTEITDKNICNELMQSTDILLYKAEWSTVMQKHYPDLYKKYITDSNWDRYGFYK